MKRILSFALALLMVGIFVGCGNDAKTTTNEDNKNDTKQEEIDMNATYTAIIKVKDFGEITVDLDAKTAPITVANFVSLAKSGFYNGLTFRRIIKGFMIQGGDPEGTGMGGSDENIKGEFAANGVENDIKHDRGVISMARSGSPYEQYLAMGYEFAELPAEAQNDIKRAFNSASSQFFIMHEDSPHLDGQYAAFGKVTKGMDVVDALAENTPVTDNNGSVSAQNQPIIESITIK